MGMQTDHWTAILTCVVLATAVVSLPASAQVVNNAQVVGSTIPTTMIPGFWSRRFRHHEEYRDATWTKAAGYRLGAAATRTPSLPGRVDLRGRRFIAPSQTTPSALP